MAKGNGTKPNNHAKSGVKVCTTGTVVRAGSSTRVVPAPGGVKRIG